MGKEKSKKRKVTTEVVGIVMFLAMFVLYSYFFNGEFQRANLVHGLKFITYCIFISPIIIVFETNEKYINKYYMYLAIGLAAIGILNSSLIIFHLGIDIEKEIGAFSRIYYLVNLFEALIFILIYIGYKKRIKIKSFLIMCIIVLQIAAFIAIKPEYGWLINLEKTGFTIEKVICKIFIIASLIFLYYQVIRRRKKIQKCIFVYFNIAFVLRIFIGIFNLFVVYEEYYLTNVLNQLCLLISNYCICRILITKVIKNPNTELYNNLVDKSVYLETVLEEYQKKCFEEEIKNELLSNISHEFKTPLNVIYSAIQMQEVYSSNNDVEKIVKYNPVIKQNCFRLIRLIDNFIDVGKIRDKKGAWKKQCENVVEIVETAVSAVSDFVEYRNINIIFDTTSEELYADIDRELFERVILNIISNSIKYNRENADILVNMYDDEKSISIEIEDSGVGIPENKQEVIFNRFERLDKKLSRNNEGTGLGLSIVKEIVEIHNGTIIVKSIVGVGTAMTVILPKSNEEYNYYNEYHVDNQYLYNEIKYKVELELSDIY